MAFTILRAASRVGRTPAGAFLRCSETEISPPVAIGWILDRPLERLLHIPIHSRVERLKARVLWAGGTDTYGCEPRLRHDSRVDPHRPGCRLLCQPPCP